MYGIDNLEADGPLTEHDYEFLKGNETYWPECAAKQSALPIPPGRSWGAALWVVYEWCRNQGLGDFGKPTAKGLKAMKVYEDK